MITGVKPKNTITTTRDDQCCDIFFSVGVNKVCESHNLCVLTTTESRLKNSAVNYTSAHQWLRLLEVSISKASFLFLHVGVFVFGSGFEIFGQKRLKPACSATETS